MDRSKITSELRRAEYAEYRAYHDTAEERARRAAERERYWARKEREAAKMSLLMRGMF